MIYFCYLFPYFPGCKNYKSNICLFQTPNREFLLRVSYLEIYNEVILFLLLACLNFVAVLLKTCIKRHFSEYNFYVKLLVLLLISFQPLYYPLRLLSFQVVNDLLNPAGQNLRIREDAQVFIVIQKYFLTLVFGVSFLSSSWIVVICIIFVIASSDCLCSLICSPY